MSTECNNEVSLKKMMKTNSDKLGQKTKDILIDAIVELKDAKEAFNRRSQRCKDKQSHFFEHKAVQQWSPNPNHLISCMFHI